MTQPNVVKTVVQSAKNKVVSTKNFVKKHRVALAVTATVIAGTYLHVKAQGNLNEFLEEHNLLEAYYDVDPTDLDEVAALHGN